jgi:hypothetical protein
LERVDNLATVPLAPPLPMNSLWRTIRGYIWWSYERGSLHYDIMVSAILLFVFLSPMVINFNDKPIQRNPHSTVVIVTPDGAGGLVYQIAAVAVSGTKDTDVRDSLRRVIEPIAGEISITKYEAVRDAAGRIQSYKVWVVR